MAEDVKRLVLQIDASVELLKRNLSAGEAQIARFERETNKRLSNIDRGFGALGKGMDGLQGKFAMLRSGAAAVGLGLTGAAFVAVSKRALDYASSLGEVSQQLGVSSDDLQRYRYIAGQVGISQEEMDKGLAKLTLTIGKAATGGEKQQKVFKLLGVDIRDASGEIKSAGQIIPELADAFQKIESPAERAAVLAELFGSKMGSKFQTLLAGGSSQIDELAAAADRLGVVLSEEQIQKADETADKLAAIKTVLEAQIAGAVVNNAEAILGLANSFAELTNKIADFWSTNPERAMTLMGLVGGAAAGSRFGPYGAVVGGAAGAIAGSAMAPSPTIAAQRVREQRVIDEATRKLVEVRKPGFQYNAEGGLNKGRTIALLERRIEVALDRLSKLPSPTKPGTASGKPRTGGGVGGLDLDDLSGNGAGKKRTDRQAYEAFAAALKQEGITPTNGFRSFGTQADIYRRLGPGNAARPGTSDHEIYKAFDFDANVDREKLARAAAAAGVRLGPELVHGGKGGRGRRHLHQTFEDGDAKGGGEAELARRAEEEKRAAEERERARKEALRREFEVAAQQRGAELEILRGKLEAAGDASARAEIGKQILGKEQEQEIAALNLSIALGDRTKAEGDILRGLINQKQELDTAALEVRKQRELREEQIAALERQAEVAEGASDLRIELLELDASLATTARERRAIELRILDEVMKQERAALELTKATSAETSAAWQNADARLKMLDKIEARRGEQVERDNQGPLGSYLESLPESAEEVNEALDRIAVEGLESLTDGIADAIMGAKSLGEVFKSVADEIIKALIKIAIQKAITWAAGQMGFSDGGEVKAADGGHVLGFASGGLIRGPGTGRSDSILALANNTPIRVSNGEYIVNAKATAEHLDLLEALNRGRLKRFATGGMPLAAPRVPNRVLASSRSDSFSAPVTINLDARGADREGLARVESQLAALKRDLPGIVVTTYADAKNRRLVQ